MTEKEGEYQDAVKDICDKPRDYLERWVLDHLKEFHRVDALNKELRTRVAELTNHEEQTHKDLGEILGTDDSLKNCALRLQTRLSTLEAELEKWKRTAERCFSADDKCGCYIYISDGSVADEFKKLVGTIHSCEQKLSTLLKASEGMEKALEELDKLGRCWIQHNVMGSAGFIRGAAVCERTKPALADFRAVKETMKKGAGK